MAMPLPLPSGSTQLSRASWNTNMDNAHAGHDRKYSGTDMTQAFGYHQDASAKSNHAAASNTYNHSPPLPAPSRQLSPPNASSLGGACMQPTWKGFIHTTRDGLVILEACLQGLLSHIPRRPHDRERQNIISSGNIFVYEENASGIRRWTDGITWSPSRIMGNFLVYRELVDGHPPGEKKRAAKKRKRASEEAPAAAPDNNGTTEEDRQLIGSLSLESYNFKAGGLAKKTLSIDVRGIRHHIISYYRVEDIKAGYYHRPTEDDYLGKVEPRAELLDNPSFKSPVEDRDDKVTAMPTPAQTQQQPSHYMQLVNAGVPVVVNVPQHQVQAHRRSISRSMPTHSSPSMAEYQPHSRQNTGSPTTSQMSLTSQDPFDINDMSHYHHSNPSIPHSSRPRYTSLPQPSHGLNPAAAPRSSPAIHQGELGPTDKRIRHDLLPQLDTSSTSHQQQQTQSQHHHQPSPHQQPHPHPHQAQHQQHAQHPQSLLYFNNIPITNSVDLGIQSLPPMPSSYPSVKYMDDMYGNSPHSGEYMHSPVYMMGQSQSYSG